jgi:hypothetical protein
MAGLDPATQTSPQLQVQAHRIESGDGEWVGNFSPNIVF